jgi:hypothetical protein
LATDSPTHVNMQARQYIPLWPLWLRLVVGILLLLVLMNGVQVIILLAFHQSNHPLYHFCEIHANPRFMERHHHKQMYSACWVCVCVWGCARFDVLGVVTDLKLKQKNPTCFRVGIITFATKPLPVIRRFLNLVPSSQKEQIF